MVQGILDRIGFGFQRVYADLSGEKARESEIQTKKEVEIKKGQSEADAISEGTLTVKINEGFFGIGGSTEISATGKKRNAVLELMGDLIPATKKPQEGAGVNPVQAVGEGLEDTANAFGGITKGLQNWGTVIIYIVLIFIVIMIINMLVK